MKFRFMSVLVVGLLSATMFGQAAPAVSTTQIPSVPLTDTQIDQRNQALYAQRDTLLKQLETTDTLYQQYLAVTREIVEADTASRIRRMNNESATRQAAHVAAAKAAEEQAKPKAAQVGIPTTPTSTLGPIQIQK